MVTLTRTAVGPGPTRYVKGSAPCQAAGATGPVSASSSGFASRHDNGTAMTVGIERASALVMRLAPSTDAQPGVSGSPGTMKSYVSAPRWMWLAGPYGPSGYVRPFRYPSSWGSE